MASTNYKEERRPLNAIQYSAKDFPTYMDAMLALLKEQYGDEYNDFGTSSVGMILVNVMSYGLSQLSWYLDRTASENYLETARTLDAVTRLAQQIGYKVQPASASSVDLTVTFDALATDGIIQEGFRFQGPANLVYSVTGDVLVSAGATTATVNVAEGDRKELTFTSNGQVNQQFPIPIREENTYVANQSVRLFVNGLEWEEKDFLDFEKTNQFEVRYTSNPPLALTGDGFAGNVPPVGSEIRIKYKVIHGVNGNVKSNTIAKALDVFAVGGSTVSFNAIVNGESASGGANPQSIESVKRFAPQTFQARKAAITQADYEALVNSFADPTFGTVSKGYAAVVRNTALDVQGSQLLNQFGVIATDFQTQTQGNVQDGKTLATQTEALLNVAHGSAQTVEDNLQTISSDMQSLVDTYIAPNNNAIADAVSYINRAIAQKDALIASGTLTATQASELTSALIGALNSAQSSSALWETTGTEIKTIKETVDASVDLAGVVTSNVQTAETDVHTLEFYFESTDAQMTQLIIDLDGNASDCFAYFDDLFSADCKANVVSVPILVKGADGFYARPSNGLISSVQSYLDGIKDVTHKVVVADGSTALIPAQIEMKVKYNSAYVKSEISANILSGVDGILKNRDFNKSLYLSDLYDIIEPIDGIDYINITIKQPTDHVNSDGNLIVNALEIVTKGSVELVEV